MYNGSKAALDMVSETLRLELAPFGVRVITCARGAIGTKFMTNSKKETLPPDSLYASIEHTITARARGDDVKNTSTPQDFAQRLVNDVISGATGHVYRGKLSSTMKLVTTWLQVSTLVSQWVTKWRAATRMLIFTSGRTFDEGHWPRGVVWGKRDVAPTLAVVFPDDKIVGQLR